MNTKQRNNRGRNLDNTIDLEILLDQLEKQGGCCAISGIPLSFQQKSHWQCSLDRINNEIGYVPSNIQLICLEFNTSDHGLDKRRVSEIQGSAQWTREIFCETWRVE